MTNQKILEKVIQKAASFDISTPHFAHPLQKYEWDDEKRYWYLGDITIPLFEIIYQHDFAKALWGDNVYFTVYSNIFGGKTTKDDPKAIKGHSNGLPLWQYRLQQLVIADDVFKYLEEHAL